MLLPWWPSSVASVPGQQGQGRAPRRRWMLQLGDRRVVVDTEYEFYALIEQYEAQITKRARAKARRVVRRNPAAVPEVAAATAPVVALDADGAGAAQVAALQARVEAVNASIRALYAQALMDQLRRAADAQDEEEVLLLLAA
jgi:hypothetical protein